MEASILGNGSALFTILCVSVLLLPLPTCVCSSFVLRTHTPTFLVGSGARGLLLLVHFQPLNHGAL